jgi:hypothetical protein
LVRNFSMASGVSSISLIGFSENSSTLDRLRCDSGSNSRRSSTSSPKKSTRSGICVPGGYRSTMPPRTANSPASPTVPLRA